MNLPQNIREVLAKAKRIFSKEEIEEALDRMAYEISGQLADSNPIFLCVVIGGMIPMGNLLPRLDFPLEVDYVHVTRYRGAFSGGDIHWKKKPSADLTNRNVIIVDDILDGGLTLAAIVDYCKEKGASNVYTAVMLDKEKDREEGGVEQADFKGLAIDDQFVFGYGLDYKEYLRNAPGIYAVAPEHK